MNTAVYRLPGSQPTGLSKCQLGYHPLQEALPDYHSPHDPPLPSSCIPPPHIHCHVVIHLYMHLPPQQDSDLPEGRAQPPTSLSTVPPTQPHSNHTRVKQGMNNGTGRGWDKPVLAESAWHEPDLSRARARLTRPPQLGGVRGVAVQSWPHALGCRQLLAGRPALTPAIPGQVRGQRPS